MRYSVVGSVGGSRGSNNWSVTSAMSSINKCQQSTISLTCGNLMITEKQITLMIWSWYQWWKEINAIFQYYFSLPEQECKPLSCHSRYGGGQGQRGQHSWEQHHQLGWHQPQQRWWWLQYCEDDLLPEHSWQALQQLLEQQSMGQHQHFSYHSILRDSWKIN